MRFLMLMLAALIVTPLLLSGCVDSQRGNAPEFTARDFHLLTLDGQQVALSDFKGQPVMLNFWATWCGPCRSEMPMFQEIYEDSKWTQKGLVILAVNLQESADDVQRFIAENGYSFTVLLDMTGEIGGKYNVRGIPVTLFIDKDGIIKSTAIGAFPNKAQIEQRLELITQ